MSGNIDFPEFLDLGIRPVLHHRTPRRGRERKSHSVIGGITHHRNPAGFDCEKREGSGNNGGSSGTTTPTTTTGVTSIEVKRKRAASTVSMPSLEHMMHRGSITSLKNSIGRSLGINKYRDPFFNELIENENEETDSSGNGDVTPDCEGPAKVIEKEEDHKSSHEHHEPTFIQSGHLVSIQSIESLASYASSNLSIPEILHEENKKGSYEETPPSKTEDNNTEKNKDKGKGEEEDDDENEEEEEIYDEKANKGCRKYLGLYLTLLSGLLYSLAALLVKLLKDRYHPFMISIWRFQGVLVPSVVLVLYRVCYMKQQDFEPVWPLKGKGKIVSFVVLMLRGILGNWSTVLQFYSLQYLEVADSMVITSSTSVFVTLFAHWLIGEKCAIVPIITALLTMGGVVVISRPPMLTGQETFDGKILLGVGLAMGCMVLAALILVVQRFLRTTHFSLISLSSGFWGIVQCSLMAVAMKVFKLPENSTDLLYGIALAVLTFFAQSFIIIALKFEQAGPVAVVQSCDVVFAFLWQFAFLSVVPDYYSLIGALIIIAGVLLTAFRKCISILPEDHKMRKRFRFLLK